MEAVAVGIFGAGDLEMVPPVLAALGTYFGERPLEVVLYDPNEEIVRIMHSVARRFFRLREADHPLTSTADLHEALALATLRFVSIKRAGEVPGAIGLPLGDWPPPLDPVRLAGMPLQLLRWVRGEDWPWEPLLINERSPLHTLLDAELAVRS